MIDQSKLTCQCGCGNPTTIRPILMAALSTMEVAGCEIVPTCGVRCISHNAAIGGAPDSRHLPEHADAVDLACSDSKHRYQLVKCAMAAGVSFIEVCPEHVHLDLRGNPLRLILGAG